MQDRRLSRDDNRGMNQGVMDNVRTRHTFRLIVESANLPCGDKPPSDHPSGQLSLGAHVSQQTLLQPLVSMHYSSRDDPAARWAPPAAGAGAADVLLASYHSHITAKSKDGGTIRGYGMTFQRVYLDTCYGNKEIFKSYPIGDGQIRLSDLIDVPANQVYDSSLTYVQIRNPVPDGILTLCPMEVRSVFINQTLRG